MSIVGDSPIEQALYSAFVEAVTNNDGHYRYVATAESRSSHEEHLKFIAAHKDRKDATVFVFPQYPLPAWRIDFLLMVSKKVGQESPMPMCVYIIECDGHEFHERTKAQAERDRYRDREASHHGFPVLRFTGSEIWRDAKECAHEILNRLEKDRE